MYKKGGQLKKLKLKSADVDKQGVYLGETKHNESKFCLLFLLINAIQVVLGLK